MFCLCRYNFNNLIVDNFFYSWCRHLHAHADSNCLRPARFELCYFNFDVGCVVIVELQWAHKGNASCDTARTLQHAVLPQAVLQQAVLQQAVLQHAVTQQVLCKSY